MSEKEIGAMEELVASAKSGDFQKQLYDSTRHGRLSNLRNNSEAIQEVVQRREKLIRRGEYSGRARAEDLKTIAASANVTQEDRREIKALLGALAEDKSSMTNASAVARRELSEILPGRNIGGKAAKNLPYHSGEAGVGLGGNRGVNSLSHSSAQSSGRTSLPKLVK